MANPPNGPIPCGAGNGTTDHDEAEARAMAEHYAAPPESVWDNPTTPEEHRRRIEALLRSAGGAWERLRLCKSEDRSRPPSHARSR